MRRPRFFAGQPLPLDGGAFVLDAEPSRHIARTLRMRSGDRLCLFDGSGREAPGEITATDRSAVTVRLEAPRPVDRESPLAITLSIAVSRGERMDTVVQKATELGVARIRPLLSERVGVHLGNERWQKKLSHWRRVAISACEQCGRNRVPDIDDITPLDAILTGAGEGLRLLLHPGSASRELPDRCLALTLLVGPEGGFSDAEVDAATAAGFQSLQLGPRVLRTETAPLAALAIAQARWGDLG